MALSIGTTTILFMRAKVIGIKQDRNPAIHTPKPRNVNPKINKLLKDGRLLPIYNAVGETLCLVGYRRKPSSRKSHQRPFMLNKPIPLGPIDEWPTPNPEA
jgi:hypothetical protein